jgi:hypothetical protein
MLYQKNLATLNPTIFVFLKAGTNVMILKNIFGKKIGQKNCRFLFKTQLNYAKF